MRPGFHATLIAILTATTGLALAAEDEPSAPRPPNFVLIIGDDHGWPDFGFMGHPIAKTPHLDALAKQSTLFPYGFTTSSECRYSLQSLLTGLHPLQWQNKVESLRAQGVRRFKYYEIMDFVTLPRLLAEHGYLSFQGGKYWEGTYSTGGFTHGMKHSMGDEMVRRWGWLDALAGGNGIALGRTTMKPLWRFLEKHRNQPFFVWFAPKLPHTPHNAEDRFLDVYQDAELSGRALRYYASVTRFDEVVGQLVDFLEKTGLRENTLLVYLSDNGWHQEPQATETGQRGKSTMYELGYRTPILFSWPGRIPANQVRDDLVSAVDLFPTFLGFAGIEPPGGLPGVNLRPALTQNAKSPRGEVIEGSIRLEPPPDSPLIDPNEALREERAYFLRDAAWRYIWYAEHERLPDRPEHELYRIAQDPHETRDVVGEHPKRASRYRAKIVRWIHEMEARVE